MLDKIKIPQVLSDAVQQRYIELNGLRTLLIFSMAENHNYIIPKEKYDGLYSRYLKTFAEFSVLSNKVETFLPQGIKEGIHWTLDFDDSSLYVEGITKKEREKRKKFKDDSYDEVMRKIYESHPLYKDKKVMEVTFQVTEDCTLACKYCYQHNKSPKNMTLEVAKKYIDTIFKQYQDTHHCIILDFIGGEPLLQPQLISDIVDYWDYKCIMENLHWGEITRISLCTNGTQYRDPKVQKLLSKIDNRLSFTVSIDGNKELHDSARIFPNGKGSYDYAIDAANDFETKHSIELGSKMTIAPSNIIFLYPAIKHYLDTGAETIFANCVYEEGWTYDDAKIFYKELKKLTDYILENYPNSYVSLFEEDSFEPMSEDDNQNWCGGNGVMLACDPDGVLYPCLRYMPSSIGDKQPALTCGHIDTGGVDLNLMDEMQKITRRSQSTDECFYCPIGRGCSWCTAYNYEVFGTINKRATFICPMHKARALANVYYWNKYYRQKGYAKRKINYCPKEWALEIIDENEWNMLNNLALED